MDLLNVATEMVTEKLGVDLDPGVVRQALAGLLGDGTEIDVGSLVSQFAGGSLAQAAQSWLGDGANAGISGDQITQVLGQAKIADFASQLGLNDQQAAGGLAEVIPSLIDQNSSGGSLLESVGGVSGLAGMASKLFK